MSDEMYADYSGEPDSYTLADLLEDGRYEDAAEILAVIEVEQPEDATWAMSLRAICLLELRREDEALPLARDAAQRAPNEPFARWTLGLVLAERNRLDGALREAQAAIAIDPGDPRFHALEAQIHAKRGDWPACRRAAEAGLAIDPADEACTALRALALRPTDSGADWQAAIDDLVHKYPASSFARAGKGWALLESGKGGDAREHFEQALALDPTSEWARHGLAESIKARNPIYAAILGVFLRLGRLPSRTRWIMILGGWFALRALRVASESNPQLNYVLYPLAALWLAFVLVSWVGKPLSDFILARTEAGRRLVRGEDRVAANLIAGMLVLAIAGGLVAAFLGLEHFVLACVAVGVLIIPVAAVFHCMPGWPRNVMATYAALNAVAAAFVLAPGDETASTAFAVSLVMSVVGSWLGAFLSTRIASR